MSFFKKLLAKLKAASSRGIAGTKKQDQTPVGQVSKSTPSETEGRMADQQQIGAAQTSTTLNVSLQNKSSSSAVYAYITGLAIDNNSRRMFIQADGRTIYYPNSPSSTGAPLEVDCAIPLGAPGSTTTAVIPRIAGGRIWVSVGSRLTFLLNPGPGLVEPSATNNSDPNINISWSFCEFTFNADQLFANLSYVDFVDIPIGISLQNASGQVQSAPGMPANGLTTVVNELRAQASRDGRAWDSLIYSVNGSPRRALSPVKAMVGNPSAWSNYWDSYVNQVWSRFASTDMTVNTQAAAGNVTGRVASNGQLSLGSAGTFAKPSSSDIFSCSTGPFATGSNDARNAVIPRLAAAFNRSTLLDATQFPNGSTPTNYYKNTITNHYARIIHLVQKDGRGYGFPYDDVVPDGGSDVAGVIHDGNPTLFTIAVGGN